MSQLGVVLQESLRRERESATSLGMLTEQMDAVDRAARRKRSLKERLGLTGIGCCGATWGFRPPAISVSREQHRELQQRETQQPHEANPGQAPNSSEPDCVGPTPESSTMNLAAALAAERQFRGPAQELDGEDTAGSTGGNSLGSGIGGGGSPGTPWRVSLMRLLEETEGGEGEVREREKGGGGGEVGNDWVCCVCMGRKKGAAFIPCGHTYCRVCSRELWLNRGCCPLCNCKILEILDIF